MTRDQARRAQERVVRRLLANGWEITDHLPALGVIWSDGSYEAGLIRERDTGEIAKGITLESVLTGEYMVEGAVLLPGAVLGCAI